MTMLLSELKWRYLKECEGHRATINGGDVYVWRNDWDGSYNISVGGIYAAYRELDALSAQAVIYELTRGGGNDEVG